MAARRLPGFSLITGKPYARSERKALVDNDKMVVRVSSDGIIGQCKGMICNL